jgi:hypothetical protein
VGSHNGANVYLKDIARIVDNVQERSQRTFIEGQQGAMIIVQKQSGGNSVAISKAIKEELPKLQKRLPSDVELEILRGYYIQLREQYRITLTSESEVVMAVMGYVDKSVYGDNFVVDTRSALYDAFARAVETSSSVDVKLESDYANDVRIIMDRINDIDKDKSIFNAQFTEYSFLQAYNELYNQYSDSLDYVFDCKNLEKAQMSAGMSLGEVPHDSSHESVKIMLNVLGF